MPKKPPRNAFYFFMQDFRKQQREKGINYETLADVSKAADPVWRTAPPSVRAQFDEIAKGARNNRGAPLQKFASTGVPLAAIQQQHQELQDAIQYEIQDITNMIKTKVINHTITEVDFYIMDINAFCKTTDHYVIGEFTVLRFNLRYGFRDFYHELVNPGRIPVGYASDIKLGSQELGLKMPDDDCEKSNYMQILANIIDYLKQEDHNAKSLPPLFTMPDKVAPVQDFILQMCAKAREDEFLFRVYKLDTMFFQLINQIRTHKHEGFPKESLALVQLKKDPFKYTPGLACEFHEESDKSVECTLARTKRWAYTVLDSCCPVAGIDVTPGNHVPADYDVECILKYKDMKSTNAVYAPGVHDSFNTTGNDSMLEKSTAWSNVGESSYSSERKEKRTYAPLRMPQADYSKNMRPAPELTDEDEFPSLGGAGRGRGAGLARSLGKMNIGK
ncbi:unnamed protein product [Chrysodeixis includens]|uniref:HMG box domain-containing protein n=1 Tax=Chrysodeixis includens TaxID=689277 RepID=A0A9P0C4Z8_CHRIL|nr:unnamed protein product [Chrysodeixis includens]